MNNRTAAALVAVALLAVAGATATGAFTTTTGVHENLEATPGTGPNGEYATVSDGQLAFAFGEVNREGITRFAGVFSLTYTGNASAEVWVDDGSSAVTFTALADSIEGEDDAVTLQPGDSLSVGVEVDTTETDRLSADGVSLNAKLAGDTGGAESVSVSQSEPGVVEVSATNVSADDPVTVDTTGSSTSENATVDSLSVTTTQSTDLSMSVSMGTENGSAPAFEFGGDAAENTSDDTADDSETNDSGAIGYINVTHEAAEETIGGAAFTFTVEKATLDERGLNHSQVQLYRYHGGSWNGVSTSMVGESPDAYTFQADSPGLSMFAIGQRGADDTNDDTGGADGGDTGGGQLPDRDDPTDPATPNGTATDAETPTPTPNGTATETATATPGGTTTPTEAGATPTETATAAPDPGEQAVEPVEEPRGFSLGRIGAVMTLVVLAGLIAYYRRRRA